MSEQAGFMSKAGAAKALGIAGPNFSKLKDFPPADEWLEGGSDKPSPMWRRSTVEAYAQSQAYRERKKFTPRSLRK